MNDLYTVSRPWHDTFSYALVKSLLPQINIGYEAYYLWTAQNSFDPFLAHAKFTAPLVILAIKDQMQGDNKEFNWWQQTQQLGSAAIAKLIGRHPTQHFVLFTSYESLDRELKNSQLTIIPFGGDIVNQHTAYQDAQPAIQKNFNNATHVLCLNRNNRDHRLIVMSYIYGLGIEKFFHRSFLHIEQVTWKSSNKVFLNRIGWEFPPEFDNQKQAMIRGYKKFLADPMLRNQSPDIYVTDANDNRTNFEKSLRGLYQNHIVEIVSETTCASPGFMLTEKTLHAYLGAVFPIFVSGQGAVAHHRELGLDVFDDVVDHSYDQIADPMHRIIAAIDSNMQLLTDRQHAIDKWLECQHRFLQNSHTLKHIYQWYHDRTCQKWQNFCTTQLQTSMR